MQVIDEKIGSLILEEKLNQMEDQVNMVKKSSKGHQTQAFKLQKIISEDNIEQLTESIFDPKAKENLINRDDILKASIKYASGILQNNDPVPEFES